MTTPWTRADVSTLLTSAFITSSLSSSKTQSKKGGVDAPPTPTIDVLITFDESGVSGHINHRSLYHGACHWLSSLQRPGHASPVALYTLSSVNVARKYSAFFDVVATILNFGFGGGWNSGAAGTKTTTTTTTTTTTAAARTTAAKDNVRGETLSSRREFPEKLVLASSLGPSGWGRAWKAMTEAHKSQMLWFRYGWIVLSRYMVVNDLKLVPPPKAAKVGPVDGEGKVRVLDFEKRTDDRRDEK